jgi:hypothetical protein
VPAPAASGIDGSPRIPASFQKQMRGLGLAGGNVHANARQLGTIASDRTAKHDEQLSRLSAVAGRLKTSAELATFA